jgi:hypothetical protein
MKGKRALAVLGVLVVTAMSAVVFASTATANVGNGGDERGAPVTFCLDGTSITLGVGEGLKPYVIVDGIPFFAWQLHIFAHQKNDPGVFFTLVWQDHKLVRTMHRVGEGACPTAPARIVQGPDRYGFCAVAGNSTMDGQPIVPGTFLNLEIGQATSDEHYKGATPAFWVEGVGITCSLSPAQAALAAASTGKVNHIGKTGDYNLPDFYTFIPKA